jgi:hypothetical protein
MSVYHLELRHFPRVINRFNLQGTEVGAIVLPWVQERYIEVGEQKWNPHEAKLTILEGEEIAVERLSMGRGWPIAVHVSEDVTERVLTEAREALGDAVPAPLMMPRPAGVPAVSDASASGDLSDPRSPEGQLGVLLGSEADRLLAAWHSVIARTSGLKPSESLALAERELEDSAGGPT